MSSSTKQENGKSMQNGCSSDLSQNPSHRNSSSLLEDVRIAAGYRYDGVEDEFPDDEEQYYPYDAAAAIEETTLSGGQANVGEKMWAGKTYTTVVVARTQERKQIPFLYLLGSILHPIHDYQRRKEYEQALFWFTYRYDFAEIKPYHITTDAGWGCMLRSAQMLLAHALRVHFAQSNQHWYRVDGVNNRGHDDLTHELLKWFLDTPSTETCFYSLHNMCAAGLAKHQVLPGEWYGPGTACYVLRDLVAMHQEQQPMTPLFRVHVATEGTVYRQVIEDLMTKDGRIQDAQQEKREDQIVSQNGSIPSSHPLDSLSVVSPTTTSDSNRPISREWDTSLLLMIPLRLGLEKFQSDYVKSLARTFALPQSVGILGGRPRGARWFFGSSADGTKIMGLDPHTVQPALTKSQLRSILQDNREGGKLPIEYLESVHSQYPETIDLLRMDPSIALGFYCRNRKDFHDLEESLRHIVSDSSPSLPDLVSFMEKAPNYEESNILSDMDVAAGMMNEMVLLQDDDEAIIGTTEISSKQKGNNTQLCDDDDDDDEDYVLL